MNTCSAGVMEGTGLCSRQGPKTDTDTRRKAREIGTGKCADERLEPLRWREPRVAWTKTGAPVREAKRW